MTIMTAEERARIGLDTLLFDLRVVDAVYFSEPESGRDDERMSA